VERPVQLGSLTTNALETPWRPLCIVCHAVLDVGTDNSDLREDKFYLVSSGSAGLRRSELARQPGSE